MLRSPSRVSIAALPVATILFLSLAAPRAVKADSYSLTTVAFTQDENFLGIDSSGNFVVNVTNGVSSIHPTCGGVTIAYGTSCFETFYYSQANPVFSTAAPNLPFDDGSHCTFDGLSGSCNNGYDILSGFMGPTRGIWAGPGASLSLLINGDLLSSAFINSRGDAVFIDATNDTLVFADDTTTNHDDLATTEDIRSPIPEPASWVLLATGGLLLFGAFRRKFDRGQTF